MEKFKIYEKILLLREFAFQKKSDDFLRSK